MQVPQEREKLATKGILSYTEVNRSSSNPSQGAEVFNAVIRQSWPGEAYS